MESQLTAREKSVLQCLLKDNLRRLSLKRLAYIPINLDKLEPETLKELAQGILKNQNKKPYVERWTLKQIIVALSIYARSPKAYKYMQQVMPLPRTKPLQTLLNNVPTQTGIYHTIINIMKNKAKDMNPLDRYCILAFGQIALKKNLVYNETTDEVDGYEDYGPGESMGRHNNIADHALLFMLQGIRKKYKQPVAHYFVGGTVSTDKLAIIIKQVIEALSEAQFKVVATVCDRSPTNVAALSLLRDTNGEPNYDNYFYYLGKTYIIYNVPHLFKSVRNNFLKEGIIQFDNYTAKWQHLIEAEAINRSFIKFSRVTPKVINPTNKTKKNVKYAAHVLSNTMSAILKLMTCSLSEQRKEELMQTAKVVEALDRLFDCTNGPASPEDIKKGVRANVTKKSNHIEKWNYYLNIMDSFVFVNSETLQPLTNVECIKGFQITLKSLKDIWNMLEEAGFKVLILRQFNLDSLENVFGFIRQHSVTNKNITCTHFTDALKLGMISGLMAPRIQNSNCEQDDNKLLVQYKDITESQKNQHSGDNHQNIDNGEITCPVLTIPEENDLS